MKRANLVILFALLMGLAIIQPALANGKADFVIKKGKVIDYDGDGVWDFLYFTLKQKNPNLEIPVTRINVFNADEDFVDVPYYGMKFNKKKTLYFVDLRGLNLSGLFSMEAVIDTSALPSSDSDDSNDFASDSLTAGKPGETGAGPKETVIIIDYP